MTNASASTASFLIEEPRASAVGKRAFAFRVTNPDGTAVSGEEVVIGLEGDGSFAVGFSSKEIKRTTDAEGTGRLTWHRAGIYGRNVRATLSVIAPRADVAVEIVETPEESSEANWISYYQPRRRY